jgi:membrane-associated phospholipid phosphatase
VASSELEKRPATAVDPADEPSAEWGWHGGFPLGTRIMGWFTAAAMFLMLIGNHTGKTEDLWLVGVGTAIVIALVADRIRARTAWRR